MSSINQNFAVLSQALNLRTMRHQVLASNIANADTPHYKARDFSFDEAMQSAMGSNSFGRGLAMAKTDRGHLNGNGSGVVQMKYRADTQSAVDGNTVDMDVERTQIADNAVQYQILTQLISDKFKGLKTAMTPTNG